MNDTPTSTATLQLHWPEYLIEAFSLGMFMVSACVFTALLEHPGSPFRQMIPSGFLRRAIVGFAMGLTALILIYSPWGKRSGAHMNPSVTMAFLRLGKITPLDAVFYVVFQFLGGWAGVALSALIIHPWIAHPTVAYAVTVPGPQGVNVAWIAEFGISALMMASILLFSGREALAPWTGVLAGTLVTMFILFEAPLSGMSLNPARTTGSALMAGVYDHIWIYFTAPVAGMLAAAEFYRPQEKARSCAKLIHQKGTCCIFCGQCDETTGRIREYGV